MSTSDDPRRTVIVFHASELTRPNAGSVEALARAQLAARRRGAQIRLCHASRELRELLELMGLDRVLPCTDEQRTGADELRIEVGREPEEREPASRVEEERDPADPSA